MIQERTVLVLGAGASAPYGYPLGPDLVDEVLSDLAGVERRETQLGNHMISTGVSPQNVVAFREALYMSGLESIDAFLERRPEFVTIGKIGIAHRLLEARRRHPDLRRPRQGAWYRYLLNRLPDEPTDRLAIVTFNYDLSLEDYLRSSLEHWFPGPTPGIQIYESIPIVHVHGALDHPNHPVLAAAGIKIIHEESSLGDAYAQAHELLRCAHTVAFLGFGYHPTNVARLALKKHFRGIRLLGTCLKLREAEQERARQLFAEPGSARILELSAPMSDTLEALRELAILG